MDEQSTRSEFEKKQGEFDTEKGYFKEAWDKYESMLHANGSHVIDEIMSERVADYYLMSERPFAVHVGEKIFYIECFTLENEQEFFERYVAMMTVVGFQSINFDLLNNPKNLYECLMASKVFYKRLLDVIGCAIVKNQDKYDQDIMLVDKKYDAMVAHVKRMITLSPSFGKSKRLSKKIDKINTLREREKDIFRKGLTRYFSEHVSKETLIQICLLVYLYNFDSVQKKNLSLLLEKMSGEGKNATHRSRTYIWSWLKNLAGLREKYTENRYRKLNALFNDGANVESKNV